MNGIPTPLKTRLEKQKNYTIIMRKGEKFSYFNHLNWSLMRTPERDETSNHRYFLVENFVLSLFTEICTKFGIIEFSLTATMSSQSIWELGASNSKGPFFQNPHNPKAQINCTASDFPGRKLVHWICSEQVTYLVLPDSLQGEKGIWNLRAAHMETSL